jgi:hypothetical protein
VVRALAAAALLMLVGCYSFDTALHDCITAGHCPTLDAGAGGGAATGGGSAMGGGSAIGGGGGGPAFAGLGPLPRYCSSRSVCWEHPLPSGNSMRAVWVFSSNNWWIAGARGLVLHYDGTGLHLAPPPTANEVVDYWSLWGTPQGDLLLSANPAPGNTPPSTALFHYSTSWDPLTPANHDSPVVTGDSAGRTVFMLSEDELFEGPPAGEFGSWQLTTPGQPLSASRAEGTGFYAVVDKGVSGPPYLYFVDAGSSAPFAGIDVPGATGLWSVLQTQAGQLWVGGTNSTSQATTFAAQWLDGGWQRVFINDSSEVRAMAELEDGDVLLACGSGGIATATPGNSMVRFERDPPSVYDLPLMGIHSNGGFAVATGVGEIALRAPDGGWSTPVGSDYRYFLRAAAANGFVAGVGYDQLIAVRDGGEWLTLPPIDPNDDNKVRGVAVRQGTLLVSTDNDVYSYNGASQSWLGLGCSTPASDPFGDLAAAGGDVWVITQGGSIFHESAGSPCAFEASTGGVGLKAIAAASPSRVWAVGPMGAAWSRDLADGGWRSITAGNAALNDVAVSSTDAYAVSVQGVVYSLQKLNGGALSGVANTDCTNALTVSETDGGDIVYVAGSGDPTHPTLCIDRSTGGNDVLPLPSDQGVNAMQIDGRQLLMFGNSFSVLSYPLN